MEMRRTNCEAPRNIDLAAEPLMISISASTSILHQEWRCGAAG